MYINLDGGRSSLRIIFSFRIHLTLRITGFYPVIWFWIRIYRISRIFKYGRWLKWCVPQREMRNSIYTFSFRRCDQRRDEILFQRYPFILPSKLIQRRYISSWKSCKSWFKTKCLRITSKWKSLSRQPQRLSQRRNIINQTQIPFTLKIKPTT
jgi:hypothetical protein